MHPSRRKFAGYLLDKLDPDTIVLDRGRGYWDTFRRCWASYDRDAQYHTVIQEDALVCDNFRELAESYLTELMPYSWYFGNRLNLRELAESGMESGYVDHKMRWSLAMCLPTNLIDEFLVFGDKHVPEGEQQTHLKSFIKKKRLTVRYTMPSLVDHRDTEFSLINKSSAYGRVAYSYIDCDKTDI